MHSMVIVAMQLIVSYLCEWCLPLDHCYWCNRLPVIGLAEALVVLGALVSCSTVPTRANLISTQCFPGFALRSANYIIRMLYNEKKTHKYKIY